MVLFNIGESDFIGHMLLENPALFGNVDTDTDAMFSSWKKHKDQIDYFVNRTKDTETPKELIALTIVVRAPTLFNYSPAAIRRRMRNLLYVAPIELNISPGSI